MRQLKQLQGSSRRIPSLSSGVLCHDAARLSSEKLRKYLIIKGLASIYFFCHANKPLGLDVVMSTFPRPISIASPVPVLKALGMDDMMSLSKAYVQLTEFEERWMHN